MLSRTSEYAVRAMVAIRAGGADRPLLAREVADQTGIPRNYLSKILGEMVRAGLLTAARGRGGGFRLCRDARRITLYDVVAPFEDLADRPRCLLGEDECSDETACPAHTGWKKVWQTFEAYLKKTTLTLLSPTDEPVVTIGQRRAAGKRSPKRRSRRAKT